MAQETLEIAVATMDAGDPQALVERLGLSEADVSVLVINQVQGAAGAPYERGRVRMHSFAERGLARSRNRALELARGDLLLLADDDIRYEPGFADGVRAAFSRHPDAAMITFRFLERPGGPPAKRYPPAGRAHHGLSIASVSSIEVGLRVRALPLGVRFDERFGLGAPYPSGEEAVFAADLRRAGARLYQEPLPLCSHDGPSSGHSTWSPETTRAKGAILRRLYPRAWPLLAAGFAVTKSARRAEGQGRGAFAAGILQGALSLSGSRPPPGKP